MTSPSKKVWTILDIINWGKDYLSNHGISNSKLELEWFLADLLECNRIDLYVRFEEPLNPIELDKIRDFVTRRKNHEPFQYILNKAPFYGYDFIVSPDVLIPRPETETLIDLTKNLGINTNFLEVGTGSGCIAVTLLKENILSSGIAIDICESALKIAHKNALNNSISNLEFIKIDFLKDHINQTFDCIISNPPYISPIELNTLDDNVVKYEPHIALTDSNDGLSFYHRFAEVSKKLLNPNGYLLLETGGANQINSVNQIFQNSNYSTIIYKDQNEEERFIEVRFNQ